MGIPESLEYFFLAVVLGVIALIVLAIRGSDSEGGSAHLLVVRSLLLCVLWLAAVGQMAHGDGCATLAVRGLRLPCSVSVRLDSCLPWPFHRLVDDCWKALGQRSSLHSRQFACR